MRRTLELSIALLLLLLLLPLLLIVAVMVRLDSEGPALFRQERVGRDLRRFTVLKFRTMRRDADPAVHERYVRALIDGTTDRAREAGLYKLTGDPRVTRVGAWLRRWSVDELPQLWNVIRGDMALVGPRPVLPYEVDAYPEWYRRRFAVKPGITGLWQVSGRNERTYEEMVSYDVEYADRKSVWMDIRILARTVLVVLGRRGVA